MEHLVSMRQRIKAIDMTKKITNAMRLISMSMHTRLKEKKTTLEYYKNTFYKFYNNLSFLLENFNFSNKSSKNKPNFIIVVGSQKGLCGVFNTNLFKFFENYNLNLSDKIVTVSKYAYDYIKSKNYKIFENYNDLNTLNFVHITHSITNLILKDLDSYNKVILFGNYSKTFFTQEPRKNFIYPFNIESKDIYENKSYIFEQSSSQLISTVKRFMISMAIQDLLYESLLSEQAARFLSMDSSTTNAQNLLNTMKLEYNKIRQANITRELTELSISFNQI